MLKGIPAILSPELLKVLCEMGHGDYIVFADRNFPAESVGKNAIVLRGDGNGIAAYLDAVLQLFPLDDYIEQPVNLMQVVPGLNIKTPIWDTYFEIISRYDARGKCAARELERYAFYEKARGAYAIVATGESADYGNIILQKGVVKT